MIVLALAVLLVPGVAIAVFVDGDEKDPVCFLAAACVFAMSLAMVAPWFFRAPAGLVPPSLGAAAGAGLVLAWSWRRVARLVTGFDWRRENRVAMAVVGLIALVRVAPYWFAAVAPGADMSMHSYTARLVVEAGGIPSGYRPLLPVDTFGASATGLPTLGAVLSALSGAPAYRGVFLAACLGLILVSLAVYAFVRSRVGVPASTVSMIIVTLAARNPQSHFEWGGNPTVLSLALATYALILLERLERPTWRRLVAPVALVMGAAVLAHAVIPYALFFILPPVLLYRLWSADGRERLHLPARWLTVVVATAVVLVPYLARFEVAPSAATLALIRHWQRLPAHVPPGPLWAFPLTVFWYVGARLGPICALWIGAALVVRRSTPAGPIRDDLLFACLTLLVVENAVVWVLPGSYALYPDRVVLLLAPIAARVIAVSVDACARGRSTRAMWAGVAAVAASAAAGTVIWFAPAMASVAVTGDDIEAIRWIDTHAPKDAVIENNYGDAGIWIPALAFRAVCSAHVNYIYMEAEESWRGGARPAFLYVGARQVYKVGSPFSRAVLAKRPDRYVEVFRRGEAAVYRLLPDEDGRLRPCAPSDAVTITPR